ncbi:response regulator [Marinobacterium sediminicola]|uniref:Two component transcriptional regulator, LuxR family n=1 Tax=Marinobacterium sediminicola TaxID=518898 RepID=A0ABY1S1S5_9GAMM|nr:response regulator [Marinobacterium sediminicola]ULG69463.1 response regulator [Marinobacterium sediminicola]SMR75613.1 two component transcriptional regulator, LuxR family [Marinobacterium sediminicola]
MSHANVILVDDHPLFRRGVAELLQDSDRFTVVAEFDGPAGVLERIDRTPPDLLLLDLQMHDSNGLELLQSIKAAHADIPVVMLTASDDPAHLMEALRLGAEGYLLKDTDPELMLTRLGAVLDGHMGLDEEMLLLLREGLRQQGETTDTHSTPAAAPADDRWYEVLTDRERETLVWISRGLSNKLIARELGISDSTVKVYVKSLLRKLNLHSRLELAAWVHNHPLPEVTPC